MRQWANIYFGEDRIVLEPMDSSLGGGSSRGEQVRKLSHSVRVEEILAELERTLSDCKLCQPTLPIDLEARMRPLLTATGEKTWNAVTRAFALIDAEDTGEELVFSPWIPDGRGFSGTGEHWRCSKSNHGDMVTAFRAAAAVAIEAQNLHNPPPLS